MQTEVRTISALGVRVIWVFVYIELTLVHSAVCYLKYFLDDFFITFSFWVIHARLNTGICFLFNSVMYEITVFHGHSSSHGVAGITIVSFFVE